MAASFAAFSLSVPVSAQAGDADIVFAARYYAATSAKGVSHSHLYRIGPDGKGRKQITFGDADEANPHFTADGKHIVFEQDLPGDAGTRLGVVAADGSGALETLLLAPANAFLAVAVCPSAPLVAVALPYGDAKAQVSVPRLVNTENNAVVKTLPGATVVAWSPDGKRLYVGREGKSGQILGPDGQEIATIARPLRAALWVTSDVLVGKEEDKAALVIFGADGAIKREVALKPMPAAANLLAQRDEEPKHLFHLSLLPGTQSAVLLAGVAGDSTSGKWWANWRVDITTGALTWWGETGDLVWGPDNKRFVTSLGRALAPFGKPVNGRAKQVWVRPLDMGQISAPERRKPLVSGLVQVLGADWKSSNPAGRQ